MAVSELIDMLTLGLRMKDEHGNDWVALKHLKRKDAAWSMFLAVRVNATDPAPVHLVLLRERTEGER